MRERTLKRHLYPGAIAAVCLAVTACASGTAARKPEPLPANQVGRPVLAEASAAMSLQSSIMALADTAVTRISAQLVLGGTPAEAGVRRDDGATRLVLSSALINIATEPDPVDALADMLTHTTLTADAQRHVAQGKAPDSREARLLEVLEQNDRDAWRLAERWLNEPTRAALKERIMAWPGSREAAAAVAYVRLSDIQRGGAGSVAQGEGMFATLRAATNQADQIRLLAERAMFLTQRMPFLLRWQMEVYTASALATQEAQRTQVQLEQMTAVSVAASKTFAGLADRLSQERAAALDDMFSHIRDERVNMIDQVTRTLQQERTATLADVGQALDAQRAAAVNDIRQIVGIADRTSTAWIGRALLLGVILIAVLLVGLLGTMLLYRRLAPVVEQRARQSRT